MLYSIAICHHLASSSSIHTDRDEHRRNRRMIWRKRTTTLWLGMVERAAKEKPPHREDEQRRWWWSEVEAANRKHKALHFYVAKHSNGIPFPSLLTIFFFFYVLLLFLCFPSLTFLYTYYTFFQLRSIHPFSALASCWSYIFVKLLHAHR